MPKGYTTKAAIENYILYDIDSSFDEQIDAWIEVAETYIEGFTGRVFAVPEDTEPEVRKYDGDGEGSLLVDDFIENEDVAITITDSVTSDLLTTDEYWLYPSNTSYKNKITLQFGRFPRGHQNILIEANFAYSETAPADIQLAATILVAGIINYGKGTNQSQVRSETIGSYSVTYMDEKGWQDFDRVALILNSYKKYSF